MGLSLAAALLLGPVHVHAQNLSGSLSQPVPRSLGAGAWSLSSTSSKPRYSVGARTGSTSDGKQGVGEVTGDRWAKDWVFRFHFGPNRTKYFSTDIRIKSSKMTATLHNVEITERHSMENYKIWENQNPLQFIDEPTNSFVLTAENVRHGYSVNLIVFHPKILVVSEGSNQSIRVTGTLEGKPIDAEIPLSRIFGQYRLTYGFLDIETQWEKNVTILRGKRGGRLSYSPGIAAAVYLGRSFISYRKPGNRFEFIDYTGKLRPIGAGITLSQKLTYTFPGDRFTASLSEQLGEAKLRYEALDGRAEQDLLHHRITLTLGILFRRSGRR